MKYSGVLYVTVALTALLYPVAGITASECEHTSQTLRTLDQKRVDAQIQGDIATLGPLLGDDLTFIHASGLVQNKAEFLSDLKTGKRVYKSIKNSDLNIRMLQGAAVITARSDIDVAFEGKENALSVRVTEVYAERNGRWQLIAYQSTRATPQP
jgi:hypothetical protein